MKPAFVVWKKKCSGAFGFSLFNHAHLGIGEDLRKSFVHVPIVFDVDLIHLSSTTAPHNPMDCSWNLPQKSGSISSFQTIKACYSSPSVFIWNWDRNGRKISGLIMKLVPAGSISLQWVRCGAGIRSSLPKLAIVSCRVRVCNGPSTPLKAFRSNRSPAKTGASRSGYGCGCHRCMCVKAVDTRRPPPSLLRRLRARTSCNARCLRRVPGKSSRVRTQGRARSSLLSCSESKKAHGQESSPLRQKKGVPQLMVFSKRRDLSIISSFSINVSSYCCFDSAAAPKHSFSHGPCTCCSPCSCKTTYWKSEPHHQLHPR